MNRDIFFVYLYTLNFPDGTNKNAYLGNSSGTEFERARMFNSHSIAQRALDTYQAKYPCLVGPNACVKKLIIKEIDLT